MRSDDRQPALQREARGVPGSDDAPRREAGCEPAHHKLYKEVRRTLNNCIVCNTICVYINAGRKTLFALVYFLFVRLNVRDW